jgi:hypothetical protein
MRKYQLKLIILSSHFEKDLNIRLRFVTFYPDMEIKSAKQNKINY